MPRRRHDKPPTLTSEQLVQAFVEGCGLRRAELERLRVRDFYRKKRAFVSQQQWIHVDAYEDIPAHEVPVFQSCESVIAELITGRGCDDLVFPTLPDLPYDRLRECYAYEMFWSLYDLIGATGAPRSVHEVGQHVKKALGLPRLDETRRRWVRRASRRWKQEYL